MTWRTPTPPPSRPTRSRISRRSFEKLAPEEPPPVHRAHPHRRWRACSSWRTSPWTSTSSTRPPASSARRSQEALNQISGIHRDGVSGIVLHEVAGGWQFRTDPALGRVRAALPAREAPAAHPRRRGDARHHRLPPARHPPRGGGHPRRGLRRGHQGAAGPKAHQDSRQERGGGPAHALRDQPRVPRVLRPQGPVGPAHAARVPRADAGAPGDRREGEALGARLPRARWRPWPTPSSRNGWTRARRHRKPRSRSWRWPWTPRTRRSGPPPAS